MEGTSPHVIKDFDLVERPRQHAWNLRGRYFFLRQAVLEMLGTQQAVKIPLEGEPEIRLREGLRRAINRDGIRLRTHREGDFLLAWVEEMPDSYLQRDMKAGE